MKSVLNHVAILVESIEEVLERELFPANLLGEVEEFESEGTRELYTGSNEEMGRLLLVQAKRDGPYQAALNKRGPGLHHIALDVSNLDDFVDHLAGSGWLLHPKSLKFYNSHKQVYLSRPGTPVLMEIQERDKLDDSEYFIEELKFPFGESRLLDSLACERQRKMTQLR